MCLKELASAVRLKILGSVPFHTISLAIRPTCLRKKFRTTSSPYESSLGQAFSAASTSSISELVLLGNSASSVTDSQVTLY